MTTIVKLRSVHGGAIYVNFDHVTKFGPSSTGKGTNIRMVGDGNAFDVTELPAEVETLVLAAIMVGR